MRTSLAELGWRSDEPIRRSRNHAIQIGLNWVGSTGSMDQEQQQEDDGDESVWEMPGRSSMALALCFSAIGLSAFPSTETLLLQTSLFVKCVDWPEYYGLASITLFVPGLVVQ